MKKIIKPKGAGKTLELIQMSHDTWSYILVADRKRADWLANYAWNELKIDIPNPVALSEYLECGCKTGYVKGILIDDADDVLRTLCQNNNLIAITMRDGD